MTARDTILAGWSRQFAAMAEERRKAAAAQRFSAIDRAHALIDSGDDDALDQFQRSGLSAFDIPTVKDFLHTVATTGQVPA